MIIARYKPYLVLKEFLPPRRCEMEKNMFSVLRSSRDHSQIEKKHGATPNIKSISATPKNHNQPQIEQDQEEKQGDFAPKCGGTQGATISKSINCSEIQLAHPALTLSSNRQSSCWQPYTSAGICSIALILSPRFRISATIYATTTAIAYATTNTCKDQTERNTEKAEEGQNAHATSISSKQTQTEGII